MEEAAGAGLRSDVGALSCWDYRGVVSRERGRPSALL